MLTCRERICELVEVIGYEVVHHMLEGKIY